MFANDTRNGTSPSPNDPFYNGLIGFLGVLAMFFNGPLLLVLVKSKPPMFLSRMNYLVGNLALADFLTGVTVFLSALEIEKLVIFNFVMLWTTIGVSFITLFLMSVERLVVLSYPLTWPFLLSTRRTLASIVATWFVSIGCGVAIYVFHQPAQFAFIVIFEISILFAVAIHVVIFGYLRKRSAFSRKFSDIPQGKPMSSDTQQASSQSSATHVILILVVIVIVTVLPNIIVLQLIISYPLGFPVRFSLNALTKVHFYFYPIELLNFVVNPIVYAWRLKRCRNALSETFFALTTSLCFVGNKYPVTEQMVKK